MPVSWPYIAAALVSTVLGIERLRRLHGEQITLTQKALIVSMFAVGIGGVAYGTTSMTAEFYNVGFVVWHIAASILIGALEIIFLTLRAERVDDVLVRRAVARSAIVTLLLVIAWVEGLLDAGVASSNVIPGDRDFAAIVNLIIFPLHAIWGLAQGVRSSASRIPREFHRRPVSTIALFMVSIGLAGFIAINVILVVFLNLGQTVGMDKVLAFSPFALGVSVAGAVLLVFGERVLEEISARVELFRLKPLWVRVVELAPQKFHLNVRHLPASARLQRAYVEISDAICTLRVDLDGHPDVEAIVSALRLGEFSADPSAPTLSQALPERANRREDLELIGALAKVYRERAH